MILIIGLIPVEYRIAGNFHYGESQNEKLTQKSRQWATMMTCSGHTMTTKIRFQGLIMKILLNENFPLYGRLLELNTFKH